MRRYRQSRVIVVITMVIIVGVASCTEETSGPTGPAIQDPTTGCSVSSNTILGYTNYERCLQGIAPLSANSQLDAAAQCHSDDMVTRGYFSHIAPEPATCGGTTADRRIIAAGYVWRTYGENLANGYSTPQAVVAAWMASPTHRANILDPISLISHVTQSIIVCSYFLVL